MMQVNLKGQVFEGRISKVLVQEIPNDVLVLLWHEDIDMLTAKSLLERKVKAVINHKPSMSGCYENKAVQLLIGAGVPVFDIKSWYGKEGLLSNETVWITGDRLYINQDDTYVLLAELTGYTQERVEEKLTQARFGFQKVWSAFVQNTLEQGIQEMDPFLIVPKLPMCLHQVKNRYVLIVARNGTYKQDLRSLRRWLFLMNPVLIAVDGAADGMLELGLKPDIILGDMDSVSTNALRSGADIICHAYPNGTSPALQRLKDVNIEADLIAFKGTSEDIAIMSAFWAEAEHLFLIGCRMGINEFLEKQRSGMASSVLTRIQVGDKLTDLKGSHPLFARPSMSDTVQKFGQDLQNEWSELKQLVGKGYRLIIRKEVIRHD